ncbi:MAG: acyl CoA:acetate/3-ketoacid CoA transferase [Acidobacteria bacterium]|nr:acyl CoA:acetate/3-ketoacid CoA transferase [Acidobacteriota bacterium]
MSKFITAQQAAMLIKDGVTIGASTQGLSGWAEEVAIAIEERFLESGHPRDITLVHSCTCGDYKKRGTTHLGHEGLTKRLICGHTLTSPNMINLIENDKIECYLLPQGVICQLWRAIAGKKIGVITSVGLGTFVDPRVDGARVTSITHEDLIKVIEIDGREQLLYKPFPVDVALIRGTVADENGNLTMDNESVIMEALPLAMAAKNSGGIVIAQAHYSAMSGALLPKNVKVPGTLVDYVVIAKPENHHQTQQTYFNPVLAGHFRVPLAGIPTIPLDARKIIGRRAAMELSIGDVINLGVGIPAVIPSVIAEEGMTGKVTTTTELGVFGGVPAIGLDFGGALNAEAMIEHASMFDYYDGGGLDVTFVGLAQADKYGNVNVSRFGKRVAGPGGFINITQNSKKVVFCGMFSIGSEEVVENGKLRITKEGDGKKFVERVEQITFSGAFAAHRNEPVMFITERGVFDLKGEKLMLTEIAPGVDLERDIFGMMEFKPIVSPELKQMDSDLFLPEWGKLEALLGEKSGRISEPLQAVS